MYEEIYNARFLQPKQSRVRAPIGHTKRYVSSLRQNDVSVSVGSLSDNGKKFHSFGAEAAKLIDE